MKYLIILLPFYTFACEKCMDDIKNIDANMLYYIAHTENENAIIFHYGVIQGLEIACKVYEINHKKD